MYTALLEDSKMFVFTKRKCLSLALSVLLLSPLTVYVFVSRRVVQSGRIVRILCFGDSLTFGMTNGWPHPYTTKLQEYFNLSEQKQPRSQSMLHMFNFSTQGGLETKYSKKCCPDYKESCREQLNTIGLSFWEGRMICLAWGVYGQRTAKSKTNI